MPDATPRAPRGKRRTTGLVVMLGVLVVAAGAIVTVTALGAERQETSAGPTAAPATSTAATSTLAPPAAAPTTAAPTSTTTQAAPAAEVARVPSTTAPPTADVAPSVATEPPPGAARRTTPLVAEAAAPNPANATHCAVRLHGKGGGGSAASVQGDVTYLAPAGNASGWGGRQWLYSTESAYQTARAAVADVIDAAGCTRVVVGGFSNGAAFAAKLYCRGEDFGGRLVRVVVDDPVTDHAVEGCSPARGVAVTLYWTGALEGQAQPGWSCAQADWTCDGGSTIGITAYAAALGTPSVASPMREHAPYPNPPELTRF